MSGSRRRDPIEGKSLVSGSRGTNSIVEGKSLVSGSRGTNSIVEGQSLVSGSRGPDSIVEGQSLVGGVEDQIWHRGKLPFEIPNFAKFCHKNCQILPQKIAKFATFCHKNCQILQIKFTYRITFFCSRRPGILHSSKDAHKKSLRCISEGRMIKNINLISK